MPHYPTLASIAGNLDAWLESLQAEHEQYLAARTDDADLRNARSLAISARLSSCVGQVLLTATGPELVEHADAVVKLFPYTPSHIRVAVTGPTILGPGLAVTPDGRLLAAETCTEPGVGLFWSAVLGFVFTDECSPEGAEKFSAKLEKVRRQIDADWQPEPFAVTHARKVAAAQVL